MFDKVLVANRGEIAVRIIRACHGLGVQAVALYAEDDRQGLHVKLADEAYLLPGTALAETYLNIPAILDIAQRAGAQAIHPGYGFLSENAEFAAACAEAGVVFIGPSAEVMRTMGSKVSARSRMEQAGVPITPGSPPLQNFEEARQWAAQIGYPVLLKASAGGGGRGMKKVPHEAALPDAFEAAVRESLTYFADGTVYLEKLVENPRHIEVQILGDAHGNVIHLGERDCSIQRRNQKLVEESPAPHLPAEVRQHLLDAAVRGAQALNYTGAGTFEFVVQNNRDAYFMEVNTRLQVEHPITEMVTGIDLVQAQLRVAAGEPLPWTQEQIHFNGHAIECRITVEDARQNFRPVPGQVGRLQEPHGPWVRVDGMLQPDYAIPRSYDSLVAKLVVWGSHREQALGRLRQALNEYEIEGVTTLLPFYRWLLEQSVFQEGHFDTGFVPTYFKSEYLPEQPVASDSGESSRTPQRLEMEVNGKRFEVAVYLPEAFGHSGTPASVRSPRRPGSQQSGSSSAAHPDQIVAPMAGTVVKLGGELGHELTAGQVACVIESMKMENDIASPRTGKIKALHVKAGEKVQAGALLLEFEPA
ncbi:MAG: acetyl/propionyl/methylcrotonyl-CoA carboxylase subunit alpha [Candidatus Sericytochromatia bacterium]